MVFSASGKQKLSPAPLSHAIRHSIAVKSTTVLLAASLVANVACVAWIATRTGPAPTSANAGIIRASAAGSGSAKDADALRAALASGNAAALEAAGLSPQLARELALGRTFSQLAEKIRAARARAAPDGRWWRTRPAGSNPDAREQQLLARRELSDALVAAFGDDLGLNGGDRSQFTFLPPEKRDALRRIIQDYDEMMAKFGTGGVQLASDREKLRLLRLERERDIAALLTPEERLAYEMRTSASANLVKNRYGDAIESESEFQKIYALQKAFDEKYPRDALVGRIGPEVIRARSEAERQLEADIRGAVGDERYSALRRAADPDLRLIDSLASRLNLPAATTDSVLASREAYATASQRITNEASTPMPERRAQIQALANQAKAELGRTLGAEAADAYAQRSPWMNMLQNGMAYSTTPQDSLHGALLPGGAQSVYPVMPAGAAQGGARQFIVNASPPIDGPAGGDTLVGGNVQVMTFSSSASGDVTGAQGAGGGAGARQVIVAPAPGTNPPATTNPAPRP